MLAWAEEAGERLGFGLPGPQGREQRRIRFAVEHRPGQGGQCPARAEFEEPGHAAGVQGGDPVGEPHRLADVPDPVVRVGQLAGDQRAGQVGHDRDLRLAERQVRRDPPELLQHRFHPRRVEGVGDPQAGDPPPVPARQPLLQRIRVTGDHDRPRAVDRGHRQPTVVPASDAVISSSVASRRPSPRRSAAPPSACRAPRPARTHPQGQHSRHVRGRDLTTEWPIR